MISLSNFLQSFKLGCKTCCTKFCGYDTEAKSLSCAPGVFSNQVLIKTDVEFVLPPKSPPNVETSPVLVQTHRPSLDWKVGLMEPERSLWDLVNDHRKASFDALSAGEEKHNLEETAQIETHIGKKSLSALDISELNKMKEKQKLGQFRKSISYSGLDEPYIYDENDNVRLYSSLTSVNMNMRRAKSHLGFTNLHSFDLNMYKYEDPDHPLFRMSSQESQGRLGFSVSYNVENSCLTVCILDAKLPPEAATLFSSDRLIRRSWRKAMHLNKKQNKRAPDTCVVMKLYRPGSPPLEQSTKTCRNTLEPSYEASFCFLIQNYDLDEVALEMVLFESDKYVKKREIGSVRLNVANICHLLRHNRMVEMWRDILHPTQVLERKGTIELSLCYRPDQEALNVGVATVRSLHKSNLDDEIYVKTTLISDEKILSRRHTDFYKHFECTILNEKYSIPLKKKDLERCALIVEVYSSDPESGMKREVGRSCLGSVTYATGHRLVHWNDVSLYRGADITRTHSLY